MADEKNLMQEIIPPALNTGDLKEAIAGFGRHFRVFQDAEKALQSLEGIEQTIKEKTAACNVLRQAEVKLAQAKADAEKFVNDLKNEAIVEKRAAENEARLIKEAAQKQASEILAAAKDEAEQLAADLAKKNQELQTKNDFLAKQNARAADQLKAKTDEHAALDQKMKDLKASASALLN